MKLFHAFLAFLMLSFSASAQIFPSEMTLDYENPKTYEIGGITLSGENTLDRSMVVLISGLSVGEEIEIPGDAITDAIQTLWSQNLFSDVKISIERVQDNIVFLDVHIDELPRLSKYAIYGAKKSEKESIRESIAIARGKVVNKNLILTIETKVNRYYIDKGFRNVNVRIEQETDTAEFNQLILKIFVDKGEKVKIKEIEFEGNTQITDAKLRRLMKETKTTSILNIFKSSKFLEDEFKADKEKILAQYRTLGYRDARFVSESVEPIEGNPDRLAIQLKIEEGNRYYFGDITWLGNSKFTDEELAKIINIKKGDVYNVAVLESRLFASMDESDISSLYLNDGYLFFNIQPVEQYAEGDTIDLEMVIYEGQQARVNKITVTGNTRTNQHVILREVRSKPGMLFSRSDITRTIRELANLGYFDPEQLNVNPVPNPQTGTVDIEYQVVEKSTSQVELQGGYGNGFLVGTFGLVFDNFSARNLFKKGGWNGYLPTGDGQRLSLRAQSNGSFFQNYNFSFTEPWLGGKKPNALTVSLYHSVQTNGLAKTDESRSALKITGFGLGLGQRLKWPDDYFTIYNGVNFQRYTLINNYANFGTSSLGYTDGYSNNINYRVTFGRSSISAPIYPRFGSNISLTLQITPPFSLFSSVPVENQAPEDRYEYIEYHKWKFDADWYTQLAGDLVLRTGARFGLLGFYNSALGAPPFERFYVGGDGLSGFVLDGRETIGLRGYPNESLTPDNGGTIFTKYTAELRYPVTLNPNSTIYGLVFAEAGNAWGGFKDYKPFEVNRSLGAGVRVFMPFFGLLGVDFGYGFDQVPGQAGNSGWQTHFMIGQQF